MDTNNEKDNKKLKRNSSQVMELKHLIGGPLVAAVEAEALSTQKYLDYLMQVTFDSYDEKFSISDGKSVSGSPENNNFRMRASLAPHSGSKSRKGDMQQSLSANMKVKVKMRTADMPAGLSNLLHLAANNLTTTD